VTGAQAAGSSTYLLLIREAVLHARVLLERMEALVELGVQHVRRVVHRQHQRLLDRRESSTLPQAVQWPRWRQRAVGHHLVVAHDREILGSMEAQPVLGIQRWQWLDDGARHKLVQLGVDAQGLDLAREVGASDDDVAQRHHGDLLHDGRESRCIRHDLCDDRSEVCSERVPPLATSTYVVHRALRLDEDARRLAERTT